MFLECGRFQLSLGRPLIMGIVNITPDSFSDGGRFAHTEAAVKQAHQLINEGADIIDLGAESTRPGATEVSAEQELARLLPVLHELKNCGKPISVDTYKPEVMRAALSAGADMINDVNALRAEGAIEAVADSNCAVCLMHMQGLPRSMQLAPHYDDVVSEVKTFLQAHVAKLALARIKLNRIVIDPGFGFGKTLQHNLALLHEFKQFTELGCASLIGVSRKRMIAELTQKLNQNQAQQDAPQDRLVGSIAAALYAVAQGAQIVRVHDVVHTRQALTVWHAASSI